MNINFTKQESETFFKLINELAQKKDLSTEFFDSIALARKFLKMTNAEDIYPIDVYFFENNISTSLPLAEAIAKVQNLVNDIILNSNNVKEWIKEWYNENARLGSELGYPKCCIDAFCNQPPKLIELIGTTYFDERRYKAAHIDGKYSGFFPCYNHAEEVLNLDVKLDDLITNRNEKAFGKFPNFANNE